MDVDLNHHSEEPVFMAEGIASKGKLVASYKPIRSLDNPKYYSHFTLSWLRGTRPASHLARPDKTSNDGTTRASMTTAVLKPPTEARRRQQGPSSPDNCASTGLKRSSDGHDIT